MAMQKLDYSQCSFTEERLQEFVAEHRMLEWTQTKMSHMAQNAYSVAVPLWCLPFSSFTVCFALFRMWCSGNLVSQIMRAEV